MFITDRFVFLHLPKTGGTFVSTVLRDLMSRTGNSFLEIEKHGGRRDIPAQYRDLPVFGCVRNPFDLKVSRYCYGWWKKNLDEEEMARGRASFAHFPDLDFVEFIDWSDTCCPWVAEAVERNRSVGTLGRESIRFVFHYHLEPNAFFGAWTESTLTTISRAEVLPGLTLLDTENLNKELETFLLGCQYDEAVVGELCRRGRIVPPGGQRTKEDSWQKYFTPEVRERFRKKERLLFKLFPEFDSAGPDSR